MGRDIRGVVAEEPGIMNFQLDPTETLPADGTEGTLVGRLWRPVVEGPSVIALRADGCYDVSRAFPTVRDVCEARNPAAAITGVKGERIGDIKSILANTPEHSRDPAKPYLLAPIDLQAVKAAGVTFAISLLERVIEEQAHGEPQRAAAVRVEVEAAIAGAVESLRPGSPEAAALKQLLIAKGMWSQYLEVGIGPDAEIFTKSQPMSCVGSGAAVGILRSSVWNNPEPEVVLVIHSRGEIVGATLGNDVNLRDIEGRSALLLSGVNAGAIGGDGEVGGAGGAGQQSATGSSNKDRKICSTVSGAGARALAAIAAAPASYGVIAKVRH